MKIQVTFKDPDVAHDAVEDEFKPPYEVEGLTDKDEIAEVIEIRKNKAHDFVQSFLKYGEYITVEFDTEAKTATVVATS